MRRRDWVGGALALSMLGAARPLQAQRRRRRVLVQLENLEDLPEGARFLDMSVAVDEVMLAQRVNAADRTSLLLTEGMRAFEVIARIEIDGRVRPIGGAYRYQVLPHHDRLVVQLVVPAWTFGPRIGGGTVTGPDDVGCRSAGPSDCSDGYEGYRIRLQLR